MKKTYRARVSAVLAALIAAASLSACQSAAQPPASSSGAAGEAASGEPASSADAGQVSGEITVWSQLTQEELDSYQQLYNSVNPNVKVNSVVFPSETYMTKLQAVLRSGAGAPDVALFEIRNFGVLKNTDLLENLSAEPYNAGAEEKNMIPYVAQLCKDDAGNFKGLSYQSCPGGFWFNKKLAKEYLGTDQPEEIQAMVADWDSIAGLCAQVYEKSGGKAYLFDSSNSVVTPLMNTRTTSFVVDNKLYEKQFFIDVMNRAKEIRDNHGDAMLKVWSAPWAAAFYESQNFILVGLPSWGLHYAIKANTPADAADTDNTWGFCEAPDSYEDGGTWLSMYAKSQNKEAAWDYIRTITLDKNYLEKYVDKTGDMVSYIPAIEEIVASDFRDPFTGDQPIYKHMYEAAKKIEVQPLTKYDQTITDGFNNKLDMALAGEMTVEEAVDAFRQDMKTQFPELIID